MKDKATEEQIVALLEKAELGQNAKKHVALARKLSSHFKIKIPLKWRRRFCRACNAFWVPGKNCRVRTREKGVVITCECGRIRRIKR